MNKHVVAWDDPGRTRRIDYKTHQDISPEEWRQSVWYDVTSISDPDDAHVYIKVRRQTMIRITFYKHGAPLETFEDEAGMASAYADYAQLCRYGITMEVID